MSVAKEIRDLMGRCSRLEQQVAKLPTRIGNSAGGSGGGGGTSSLWVTAPTKDDLPSEPNLYTFGRVDGEDPDNGMICVVNAAHNGWDAINFFE